MQNPKQRPDWLYLDLVLCVRALAFDDAPHGNRFELLDDHIATAVLARTS